MSVQFGRWNFAGEAAAPGYTEKVHAVLTPYGPNGSRTFADAGITILYRAFHTTAESRNETQPHVSPSGVVTTWDGRLDNRKELTGELRIARADGLADVVIVAEAYERWGTECFARLLGDWALTVWNPNIRSLILAKDYVGTRHLFYAFDEDRVIWSTILDPLLLCEERTFTLDQEYIAGWFSFFPAAHLTPYVGIHAVPPSCFVLLRPGGRAIKKYWDFDPRKRIRYRTDSEYEEHFRTVFATAVRRRLRSDAPILAELSGGMDSSSIVCMAHTLMVGGTVLTPRLDTVSYYNDSDPDWNERPYFTKVEEMRGRTGCHIEVGRQESTGFEFETGTFAATPATGGRPSVASQQFAACLASQGNRVVLSGIGGDEVTGGVPTPTPELMDLLARTRFKELAHRLKVWALNKRKPWFHLFFDAVRGFLPPAVVGVPKHMRPLGWLQSNFVKRHRAALTGYPSRVKLFRALPTFQENMSTLDVLRRQLTCSALPSRPLYEMRYPYLDRTLLEFLFAIPREQLLRPGERRSLMRRALIGIVPSDLLNRKRKAFAARSSMTAIPDQWIHLVGKNDQMLSHALGIVDSNAFYEEVQRARHGREIHVTATLRALLVESWLRTIQNTGILKGESLTIDDGFTACGTPRVLAGPLPNKSSAS